MRITARIKPQITVRTQSCPVCDSPMGGDMHQEGGSRDAYCPTCGYKDPYFE